MLPGAREAYLPIEGTDLDTEANQLADSPCPLTPFFWHQSSHE
jgi:hypothetical protein